MGIYILVARWSTSWANYINIVYRLPGSDLGNEVRWDEELFKTIDMVTVTSGPCAGRSKFWKCSIPWSSTSLVLVHVRA